MTQQETFKRRIRERMVKTGERYTAARRALIAEPTDERGWVADPELSDERVRAATGRGWEEWRQIIDDWPGHDDGHSAIASYVRDDLGVDDWWAQTVTVGYERITGRRLPYQQPDGTFTAGKSRTVTVDRDALRELLLSEEGRADLFPNQSTALRSRSTAKVLRLGMDEGVTQVAVDPLEDGRAKIAIAHEKLPTPESVELWKAFWTDWLEALDES